MSNKRKKAESSKDDDYEIDPLPKHLHISSLQDEKRLIVILEGAQLETICIGKSFELMNADDHANALKKYNRDARSWGRPDIVHQCLLMLMDSPLNRASLLQVFIHTEKNILIEINPQTRIPRTFKRFAGLMVQLLHRFKVRAADGNLKLLKVIKNPVTDHLPAGCRKYATSFSASKIVHPKELVHDSESVVVVIGAMAHGSVNVDYTEETVSFSNYPLSAALTCAKLCSAFEESWGIV